jgi:hypothetical protein
LVTRVDTFLSSGVQDVFTEEERIAPLRIVTPTGDINYFVKIVDADTNSSVLTAYIRAGETLDMDLPIGRFRLRYAMGRDWYGSELLFGSDTSYAEADTTLDFHYTDEGVRGYTIELIRQEGGNLETKYLSGADF